MAKEIGFTPELFRFLAELKANNNREWFEANKARYLAEVRDPFLAFIAAFRPRLEKISTRLVADPKPVGGSMLRIYRDLRFSKSKDPYKPMAAAHFQHGSSKDNAPSFYLHLSPDECFLGAGLWQPDTVTRRKVTDAIFADPGAWKKASANKAFLSRFEIAGSSLAKVPKHYDPGHPFAEDLKRKDFIGVAGYSQSDVCSAGFLGRMEKDCRAAAPYLEFLTRAIELPW
ncbi:MAG: DUF2461 domain-containing protein [Blastocatellales bacterium]